jgi:hypothetical protein
MQPFEFSLNISVWNPETLEQNNICAKLFMIFMLHTAAAEGAGLKTHKKTAA